jgi:hypothetical protein
MRTLFQFVLLLAAAGGASASDGLSDARAARSLLGPTVWARVARIDNAPDRGAWRRNPYPRTVYALVFELSGVLWFYTDTDGTQSLSLRFGSLDTDEADPGPLFLAIDPAFRGWSWVGDGPDLPAPPPGGLPNGCFVESVAAFLRRIAVGGRADAPRLLSYYVDTASGRRGHTVLVFDARGGLSAIDPELSERPVELPAYLGADPRSLSAYLRGGPVAAARIFPIGGGRGIVTSSRWAALPRPAPPAS